MISREKVLKVSYAFSTMTIKFVACYHQNLATKFCYIVDGIKRPLKFFFFNKLTIVISSNQILTFLKKTSK